MANINDLRFGACAYFYKLKEGKTFSATDIRNMLAEVTSSKINRYLFNEVRQADPSGVMYSIRVFKDHPKTPGFMSVPEEGWKEQKIGYFIFLEYRSHVAILRKYCTVPKTYADKLENIKYEDLIALFATENTQFQTVSMQNMDASDHAMRYKSYQALNLKENISPIGTSHYYLRSVKGANDDDRFALTIGASRINEFEKDYNIHALCSWVKDTIDAIEGVGALESNFMKIFAKPEKYTDVYQQLEPSSLLVFYGLIMAVHDEQGASFFHVKNGNRTLVDDVTFYRYMQQIMRSYELVATIVEPKCTRYFTGIDNAIEIRKRKSGIMLLNKTWKNIEIEGSLDGLYDGTLQDLINQHQLFNVYFTDTELVYSNKTLFRDTRLMSSAPHFVDVMKPKITRDFDYEKHPGKSPARMNDWHADSMFKFVEDTFKQDYTYFICDDCGTEWADHIGISTDRVTFFVEKHKASKDSASDFQDVVGQALKNLANLIPSDKQLEDRREFWSGLYQTSNMQRYRSSTGNVDEAIAEWKKNNLRPNCKREMCIVVDFLSRANFKQQLDDIANGNAVPHEAELRQRLWLLSSFVNSCLEYGVQPLIYCKR